MLFEKLHSMMHATIECLTPNQSFTVIGGHFTSHHSILWSILSLLENEHESMISLSVPG